MFLGMYNRKHSSKSNKLYRFFSFTQLNLAKDVTLDNQK